MTTLSIGQRVRLTQDFGDYPMTPIPAGSTGTVVEVSPEFYGVALDHAEPQLAAWNNVLQVAWIDENGMRLPNLDNESERYLELIP